MTNFKTHRLDVNLIVRTALSYLLLFIIIGGMYTAIIIAYYAFLSDLPNYSVIVLLSSVALLLALAADPLKVRISRQINRILLRGTHSYREALLNFATTIGTIINLDELANGMLPMVSQAINAPKTWLLVPGEKGDFCVQSVYPVSEQASERRVQLNLNTAIVEWLVKQNIPLDLSTNDSLQMLQDLPDLEKDSMIKAKVGVLCPVKSRGRLVAILALSSKSKGDSYSYQDMKSIMALSGQIGPMMENAQLYSKAVSMAVTDELTGLYNHRQFHIVMNQEIARCSRYGSIFSLIMMDIDFFKAYNDTFGHLSGDEVLHYIGELVRAKTRATDTAFRFGGEEFAIILPETTIDNAFIVAERIRENLETKSSVAVSITASLGISGWPADGITKEDIISRADAALYQAKRTGRNRTCLSIEIATEESFTGSEFKIQETAASTVYAFAAVIDAKDHYTFGHSKNVSALAVSIAEQLGFTPPKIAVIRSSGLLHDIGKIAVPDSILTKDGNLTEEEWQLMKLHPKRGVEIVRQVVDLKDCLPFILHHHERIDGKGYPLGLKGDDIPLEARILAIADAYDALTSARRYRAQLKTREALYELQRCAGTQFDSYLVGTFCDIVQSTRSEAPNTRSVRNYTESR